MTKAAFIKSVQEKADEQITALGPRVIDGIVDRKVTRELDKRVDVLAQGVDKLEQLEEQLVKLMKNPDNRVYGADLKPIGEPTFSEKKKLEIEKLTGLLNKLQTAMEKAYNDGDVKELNQLLQAKGDNKPEGGAGDSEKTS